MDKNFQSPSENVEVKSKWKNIWIHVGYAAIAITLAIVTVFVLNLNV